FPVLSSAAKKFSCAIVMVGSEAAEVTLESLNEQTQGEWVAVSLPALEDPFSFPAESGLQFLAKEGADCDFVVFALAGTLFAPATLERLAGAFAAFPEAEMLYPDVDVQSDDGSVWPLAFPAFDYERLLEQGYCSYLFALRRSTAERILKAGATTLYKLCYSVLDNRFGASNIIHLPGATAVLPDFDKPSAALALATATKEHLERIGIRAQVICRSAGVLPAIQVTRTYDRIPITIIIPTRNRSQLLRSCL